jgi:hypothetical protein
MIETEEALQERAARWAAEHPAPAFDAAAWREIAAREGIDFATALLFQVIVRSPQHAVFIQELSQDLARARELEHNRAIVPGCCVAIVPAAFYKEKPGSGADGRVVRAAAAAAGLRCELIPVHSTGTLSENAAILVNWLSQQKREPMILVSLCKGGADVKVALARAGAAEAFGNVPCWVNICGTLSGSPLAQWLLSNKGTFLAAWIWCKCRRRNFEFLRELRACGPLAARLRLPETMQLVSLAGFPLRQHLTNGFMRRCHAAIAPMGPNDGGMLLAEAAALPGLLYPVWKADHYFRPEEQSRRLLVALFERMKRELAVSR